MHNDILKQLPKGIAFHLEEFCNSINIGIDKIEFWLISDYGVFMSMHEKSFSGRNFQILNPIEFIKQMDRKENFAQVGSRKYLKKIVDHFISLNRLPIVLDIGGFLGRFAIEAALMFKEYKLSTSIYCFEPGLSCELIKSNFKINQIEEDVCLVNKAVHKEPGKIKFCYSNDNIISGKVQNFPNAKSKIKNIISGKVQNFLNTKSEIEVETICIEDFLAYKNNYSSIIAKIDTEGNEHNVFTGFGSLINSCPGAYIAEFAPWHLQLKVDGIPYRDFLNENFLIFDITNCLYPKKFDPILRIEEYANDLKSSQQRNGLTDILCLHKSISQLQTLKENIEQLGE